MGNALPINFRVAAFLMLFLMFGSAHADDATSPIVTIITPYSNPYTYGILSIPLNFTATDDSGNISSCWYVLDNGGQVPIPLCAPETIVMSGFPYGIYQLEVFASDPSGNAGSSSVMVLYDPCTYINVTIAIPLNGSAITSASTPLNYTMESIYDSVICRYVLDGGPSVALPGCLNGTLNGLSAGQHTVSVYADSPIGYTAMNSSTFTVVLDSTPPVVAIQSPANTTYGASTVSLNYTATDNSGTVSSCTYSLDGGSQILSPLCANATLSSLSNGAHSVSVYAVDPSGNTGSSSVSFTVNTDTSPPTVDAGIDHIVNSPFTQNATATDSGAGIASYQWGMVFGPGNVTFGSPLSEDTNISASADGAYAIMLAVADFAGNSANDSAQFIWDTSAPQVNITSFPNVYVNNQHNTTINGTCLEDGNISLSVDDSNSATTEANASVNCSAGAWAATLDLSGLDDGTLFANAYQTDEAGNTGSASASSTKSTVLQVALLSPANNTATRNSSITFVWESAGAASCTLSVAGAANISQAFNSSNGSFQYNASGLYDGIYYWSASCSSENGASGTSQVFTFTIDSSAPVVLLLSPANNSASTDTSTSFSFKAVDSLSLNFTCSLFIDNAVSQASIFATNDTASSAAKTSPIGVHTWRAECADSTGNIGVSENRTYSINSIAPPSGGGGGSSSGGGGSSGGSSSYSNSAKYNVDICTRNCTISLQRTLASANNASVLTVRLTNEGGEGCSLTGFAFTDSIPASFAQILGSVAFSPQYASADGNRATFTFPSFGNGESRTITYSKNGLFPSSKVADFNNVALFAKSQCAAPAEPPLVVAKPAKAQIIDGANLTRANATTTSQAGLSPINSTRAPQPESLAAASLFGLDLDERFWCLCPILLLMLLLLFLLFAAKRCKACKKVNWPWASRCSRCGAPFGKK